MAVESVFATKIHDTSVTRYHAQIPHADRCILAARKKPGSAVWIEG
jgi:hypothetical protein